MAEAIPRPGEKYRHFKGNLYQVITLATHSETGEKMVIYQALYGDFEVYARPLSMFLSDVDLEKYPQADQKKRFEPVSTDKPVQTEKKSFPNRSVIGGRTPVSPVVKRTETLDPDVRSMGAWPTAKADQRDQAGARESVGGQRTDLNETAVNQGKNHGDNLPKSEQEAIMYFLDFDTYAERWTALSVIHEFLSDHMIDTLAAALDIVVPEGNLEERFGELRNCISAFKRFESNR